MATRESGYDPRLEADTARRWIGLALLALLVLIVLMGFAALFLIGAEAHRVDHDVIAAVRSKDDAERLAAALKLAGQQSQADAERLAVLLNIIFGPVVTLLGSVTGFYFGTSRRSGP